MKLNPFSSSICHFVVGFLSLLLFFPDFSQCQLFAPGSHGAGSRVTRSFHFSIQHSTPPTVPNSLFTRSFTTVNNISPGPPIVVFAGQHISVSVTNELPLSDGYGGTTLHWHGMQQWGTPDMDGSGSVTQCPIQSNNRKHNEVLTPNTNNNTHDDDDNNDDDDENGNGSRISNGNGSSSVNSNIHLYKYNFLADRPGTFWYHGHYAGQYVDGEYGPLVILNPNGEVYDSLYSRDLVWMISDYYSLRAATILPYYLIPGGDGTEPIPDAITLNGQFAEENVEYQVGLNEIIRLRLINAAAFSMYRISIDAVPLDVIEVDGTLTQELPVFSVVVNVAQRVSVLVDFARIAETYPQLYQYRQRLYFRIEAVVSMYPVNVTTYVNTYEAKTNHHLNPVFIGTFKLVQQLSSAQAQLRYADRSNLGLNPFPVPSPPSYPAPYGLNNAPPLPVVYQSAFIDNNLLAARPLTAVPILPANFSLTFTVAFATDPATNINRGYINGLSTNYPLGIKSLLQQVVDGDWNYSSLIPQRAPPGQLPALVGDSRSLYYVPLNAVVDLYITNTDTGEHPFHLHGAAFWLISTSDYPAAETNFSQNYLLRDVVSVPALGWAKLRWFANNPGVLLFHCHIEWHMSAGLVAGLVVAPEKLRKFTIAQQNKHNCQQFEQSRSQISQSSISSAPVTRQGGL